MRNEFKMFFYTVFLIFGKSNAFIVDDYSGAVASYNSNVNFLPLLSNLKKHTTNAEIILSDNQKKLVNGYANGNSFFILRSFLLNSFSYNYKLIKEVNYTYDSNKIKMDHISLLERRKTSTILSITEDIVEVDKKNLSEFSHLFYNTRTIRKSISQHLLGEGNVDFVKKIFTINNWGNWNDYFDSPTIIVSDQIKFFSTTIVNNLWFIIGKPNDKSVDEVIPLEYINDNLSLISYKLTNILQPTFLIPINGLKFRESDIGAYLVKCIVISFKHKMCKFFGQIIKVVKISEERQMVVGKFIVTDSLNRTGFLFKSQIRKTLNSVDLGKEKDSVFHNGKEGDTLFQSDATSLEIDKMKSTTSTAEHKDEDKLDVEFPSKSKKQKPNYFDKDHLSLFGFNCDSINTLGEHVLTQEVTIKVNKINDDSDLNLIFTLYDIEGLYIIDGKEFKFNGCYQSPDGDYLVKL